VRRGVECFIGNQQADGSWYGRWGVAYIYGTCFALRGLAASGETTAKRTSWRRRVAAFHPERDGGWGESCASYDNEVYTPGPSTPSQSAWAILVSLPAATWQLQRRAWHPVPVANPVPGWKLAEELATGTGSRKCST